MKQTGILALAIAVILFAASCSKNKGDKPSGSIEGVWKITHIHTVEPTNDVYDYDDPAGDYMEFSGGSLFIKVGEYEKTESYEIIDAAHINRDGFVSDIQELTDHKLVLHSAPHDGQPEDLTYTMSK